MRKLTKSLVGLTTNAALKVYSKLENKLKSKFPIILFMFILTALPFSAEAAVFTVTNINDSGAGSLRQAVIDANGSADSDTIEFAFTSAQTILLTSGELTFSGTITINGSPLFPITISGNNNSRIFNGNTGNSTLTLNNLNLTGGRISGPLGVSNGGAISIFGPLVLNNCAVYGNTATNGTGGGIYHGNVLILNSSTISGNSASGSGGGLEADFASSSATINDSTIAFNHSGTVGGGVHNAQASYVVRNSIIAQNTATTGRPDFSLTMNSQGYNIVGNTSGANIVGSQLGNQLNVDPLLLPLALNNGSTMTHALQFTSPAIDAGNPSRIQFPDQRGTFRGSDGDSDGTRGGDIGAYEKLKSQFDFDNDETSDISVIRTISISSITEAPNGFTTALDWYSQTISQNSLIPNAAFLYQRFGLPGDIPVPADYDGDAKTDIAVYRPSNGTWYIIGSTQGFYGLRWGISTDVPVPADYDGDGKADVATFRNGVWYILNSQLGYTGTITHGTTGNIPVPADYDGDGKTDLAVFNGTNWSVIRSASGLTNDLFGLVGDIPVVNDYDGDGKANLAIFRPTTNTWYIAKPTGVPAQNFDAYPFGLATDKLAPADYDGDGRTDIAVLRNSTWWIFGSRRGLITTNFGLAGDEPTPGVYIQ